MSKASWFISVSLCCGVMLSCNKAVPAAFWEDFPEGALVENISDQGPYGGHRAMHWQAKKTGAFTPHSILRFAETRGWKLQDSLQRTKQQLLSWRYDSRPIFPLAHEGFTETVSTATFQDFPRWIETDATIYRFKTGWMAIEPGSDLSTEENGFVIVDQTRSAMSVYHLWGE